MLDLKLTLGCKIFISYTIVSVITRNFVYEEDVKYVKNRRIKAGI